MQIEDYPARGPSRFGRYFGNGTPDSGYDEIYIFSMNKIPGNYFPKKADGNYDYWSYYKYGAIMTGFTAADTWNYGQSTNSQERTYGQDFIIPTWRVWNYGSPCSNNGLNSVRMKLAFFHIDQGNQTEEHLWADACLDNSLDKWFGIEYYLKLGTPGQSNGHITVWIYDAQGNVQKVFDQDRVMLLSGHNYKWNYFFFGGNKSWKDSDYPNLDTNYYVDDFIINGSRIGPKYFASLQGTPGDTNNDSIVDILDLQACVNVFLGTETDPGYVARADLNEDGVVDVSDLTIITANFGSSI